MFFWSRIHLDVSFQHSGGKHHNDTESVYICERSELYVQDCKYFRFGVAILKCGLAVNSNGT